jgi:hypothetical protein
LLYHLLQQQQTLGARSLFFFLFFLFHSPITSYGDLAPHSPPAAVEHIGHSQRRRAHVPFGQIIENGLIGGTVLGRDRGFEY